MKNYSYKKFLTFSFLMTCISISMQSQALPITGPGPLATITERVVFDEDTRSLFITGTDVFRPNRIVGNHNYFWSFDLGGNDWSVKGTAHLEGFFSESFRVDATYTHLKPPEGHLLENVLNEHKIDFSISARDIAGNNLGITNFKGTYGPKTEDHGLLGHTDKFWMDYTLSVFNTRGSFDAGPNISVFNFANLQFRSVHIPEPASLPLMAFGLIGLWMFRNRPRFRGK